VQRCLSLLTYCRIITYIVVAALLSGSIYGAYVTFVPQTKKPRRKQAAPKDASTPTASATGTSGYQEEWIPAHHLKKSKKVVLSSDEETSPVEGSGREGRKRKGKK
jgi:hypothetical protein